MSPTILLFHSILLATSVIINAEGMDRTNHNTEFFITMPESTTVFIQLREEDPLQSHQSSQDTNNQTYSNQTRGEFQCVTRPGYLPLWIINGVSADIIEQKQPGYTNTTYELIPLHDQGHTLTILSIPASQLTNHSVVTCAAVKNETKLNIVGYSSPVTLFVQIKGNSSLNYVGTSTTLPSSSSVTSGMNTAIGSGTTAPPVNYESLGAGAIVLLLATAAVLLILVVLIIAFRRKDRHRRLTVTTRNGKSNIYWNVNRLKTMTSETEQDDKKATTKL